MVVKRRRGADERKKKRKKLRSNPLVGELEEEFDSLRPFEKRLVLKAMQEMRDEGHSRTLDSVWERDFLRKPVSIEEFIEDDYYMGRQAKELFPKVKEELYTIFRPNTPVQEVIMGGSIGWGKTTLAAFGMTYLLYFLSCLRDPHGYFKLAKGSNIVLGIYSVTKTQAYDSSFSKIRTFIDESPYFRDNFPRVQRIKSKIVFHNGAIQVIAGCVAEGTLIATPNGDFAVEDLYDTADLVMSLDHGLGYVPYASVMDSGRQTCVDLLCSDDYTLRCSENHKVMVVEGDAHVYKKAKDLKPGDRLLSLRREEDPDRILHEKEREAQCANVQGVCTRSSFKTLSCDEELSRQESALCYVPQSLLYLPRGASPEPVSCDDTTDAERLKDVLEKRMQELRGCADAEVLSKEFSGDKRESEDASQGSRRGGNTSSAEALAGILRRSPRRDTGEATLVSCAFTFERDTANLAFQESGEDAGICAETSKALPGVVQTESKEVEAQVSCKNEVIEGVAYFEGRRLSDGVLWEQVRLLWKKPYGEHADSRPRNSGMQGRSHDTGKYGSCLQELQLQQKRDGLVEVVGASPFGEKRDRTLHDCRIQEVTLLEVRDAGVQQTYDVVEAASPNHSIITNGIVSSNSTEFHAIGLDMFAFLLDEANFLHAKSSKEDSDSVAMKIYNNAKTRLKSRFLQTGGTLPGMVFLVSSKKTHRSFLEKHIDAVKGGIKEGSVHLIEFNQWEVRPSEKYTAMRFRVEIGDQIYPSRVLPDGDEARPGADVIVVPGEFRSEFDADVDQALRDIAGVATYGVCPLIHNKAVIKECYSEGYAHPFVREEVVLSDRNDVTLDYYFSPEKMFVVRRSNWIVKNAPHAPRFIHIDLGLTGDCAGIASSHVAGFKELRRQRGDGTYYVDRCPRIGVDFMLRIRPPSDREAEIDISKIRSFVISLRDMGLPIIKVTADGFQSRDFMQIMRKIGFESNVYSVDRTDEPYLYLRQAFIEKRLEMYAYDPVFIELCDLERDIDRRKVDHPKTSNITGLPGSKDVADALCGSVAQCMIDPRVAGATGDEIGGNALRSSDGGPIVTEVTTRSGTIDWDEIERQAKGR